MALPSKELPLTKKSLHSLCNLNNKSVLFASKKKTHLRRYYETLVTLRGGHALEGWGSSVLEEG
jgi:hypothetical protein